MKIEASARLLATNDLADIQGKLKKLDLQFFETGDMLVLEIGDQDDVEDTVSELQKQGYKLRVDKGVLSKNSFAVKGGGIVVQRVGQALRIFKG